MSRRPVDLVRASEALDRIGAILDEHPEIVDRTAAALRGDLPILEHRMPPVNVRIPPELYQRAEALVGRLGADPKLSPLIGRKSITAVIRLALIRGLDVLDAELPNAPGGGSDVR